MANERAAQNRYAFPRYKVYIFGVEVTADVVAVNANYHDGDAPNTCQITLLNEFDKYILTSADLIALHDTTATRLNIPWITNKEDFVTDTPAGLNRFGPIQQGTAAFENAVKSSIFPQQKRDVLLSKNNVIQSYDITNRVDIQGNPIANSNLQGYFGAAIKKYPLQDGAP